MILTCLRALIPGLLLALVAGQAWAEVTLTFYAHPGARFRGGDLLFPHAYVHANGTREDTGEPVNWAAGFTARNPGPQLLFGSAGGVVQEPDQRYIGEGRGYLRLVVSDAVFDAVRARSDWWTAAKARPTTSAGATASPSSPIWRGSQACRQPRSRR